MEEKRRAVWFTQPLMTVAVLALVATSLYNGITANSLLNKHQNLNDSIKEIKEDVRSMRLKVDSMSAEIDTLKSIHPWRSPRYKRTSSICKEGTFFGFVLYTPVDTSICPSFKTALASYSGPQVRINSLRRHGTRSKHCSGRAVDLELSEQLVEYLVSPQGEQWLRDHGLSFMIEGKPGSKRVRRYVPNYGKYVFFNSRATGDHIHLAKA